MEGRPLDVTAIRQSMVRDPNARFGVPRRVGLGPLEASTSVALAVTPVVVWDVNGYYRALGFSPPFRGITKKALREAYQAAGGPSDAWLTAVFRMLIDPVKRHAYDCAPVGEKYLDEVEIQRVTDQAKREAMSRTRTVADCDALLRELLDKAGLVFPPAPGPADPTSPNEHYPEGEDKGQPIMHTGALPAHWRWSYYVWDSARADVTTLAAWQELLIHAFAAQEVTTRFSVGFAGRGRIDDVFVVQRTYGVLAIYLREDVPPSLILAHAAVSQARQMDPELTRI